MKVGAVTFKPNPLMVTAAVAHVECFGAIRALQISYDSPDHDSGRTPRFSVSSCPVEVEVLGLLPSTHYDTRFTAWGEHGEARSVVGPALITDPLPASLPRITVQVTGSPSAGLTVFGVFPPSRTPCYAFIVDSIGRIRWYLADSSHQIIDLEPQPNDHYTLTLGTFRPNGPAFEYDELDVSGNVLRRWNTSGGYSTDNHEFRFTPKGTGLLLGVRFITMNLSAYGGSSKAQVIANALEEVDSVGRVLFQWNAIDHFAITDIDPSMSLSAPIVDWTHSNAIEIDHDGNYLLSSRDFSEITKIDSKSGAVIWRWGGVKNEFQFLGDTLKFSFQHAIRRLANGDYILFDNGNTHHPRFSRAVEYRLDPTAKTATLVWSYRPTPDLFSSALGFAQRLANGNTLVTFGLLGTIHEVSASGQLAWKLTVPSGRFVYRAYRIRSLYAPQLVHESRHRPIPPNGSLAGSLE